jgi:hypothetical protein
VLQALLSLLLPLLLLLLSDASAVQVFRGAL